MTRRVPVPRDGAAPVPGGPSPRPWPSTRRGTASRRLGLLARTVGLGSAVVLALTACGGDPPSGTGTGAGVTAQSGAPVAAVTATVVAGSGGRADVTSRRAVAHAAVVVRRAPSASAAVLVRLPAVTSLGSPRVLLVTGSKPGWVQVQVPVRPNGSTGWVAASAVKLEVSHDQVTVDLTARRMTVVLDGVQVASTKVGIGSAADPTPTGTFFVTDRVRPTRPTGAYGAFALGLSAHSTTLSEFGGGDGQVGIHGTNAPSSIGQAVSHGCVRVPDAVTGVLARVPLGTPVVIS